MRKFVFIIVFVLLTACAPVVSEPIPTPSPTPSPQQTPTPTPQVLTSAAPEETAVQYDPVAHNFMPYDQPFKFDSMLSREQVLEDYLYMWQTLEDNAPYLADLPNYPRWAENTPQQIKSRNELKIKEMPDLISLTQYRDLIGDALSELGVGHIFTVDDYLHKMLQNGYKTSAENASDEYLDIFNRLTEFVNNPKTLEFYQYFENIANASDDVNVGENDKYNLQEIFESIVKFDIKGGTPYVKIKSFGGAPSANIANEYNNYMIERLKDFCKQNKDSKDIIIDIRGNPGGSTDIWDKGFVNQLYSSDVTSFYLPSGSTNGGLNTYIWGGKYPADNQNDWQESYPNIGDLSRFDAIAVNELVIDNSDTDRVGFNGKTWLLVDGKCASASELFTVFCKQTGFATIVGTRTGGKGISGQPYTFPLPNSGMLIYYEAWYGFNDDGTCNQIVGTNPDIDVGKRDALTVCLEMIAAG